jgi:hypothetical protein
VRCKDVAGVLVAYVDNEVTLEERRDIELHLDTCSHCLDELAAISSTREQLHQAFDMATKYADIPDEVWVKIKQRVAANRQVKSSPDKSRFKFGGILEVFERVISGQPKWRVALTGAITVVIIVALSVLIPLSPGGSDSVAVAAEIARGSIEVKNACGGDGEVDVLRVNIENHMGQVVCLTSMGQVIKADIDLTDKRVISTEPIALPKMSDVQIQQISEIAQADPRVQQFFDEGATSGLIFPVYEFKWNSDYYGGNILPIVNLAVIELTDKERNELIHVEVNLDDRKIESITEIELPQVLTPSGNVIISSDSIDKFNWEYTLPSYSEFAIAATTGIVPVLSDHEKQDGIDIARADPRVSELLDQGATVKDAWKYISVGLVRMEDGSNKVIASTMERLVLLEVESNDGSGTVVVDLASKEVMAVETYKTVRFLAPQSNSDMSGMDDSGKPLP